MSGGEGRSIGIKSRRVRGSGSVDKRDWTSGKGICFHDKISKIVVHSSCLNEKTRNR